MLRDSDEWKYKPRQTPRTEVKFRLTAVFVSLLLCAIGIEKTFSFILLLNGKSVGWVCSKEDENWTVGRKPYRTGGGASKLGRGTVPFVTSRRSYSKICAQFPKCAARKSNILLLGNIFWS